MEPPTSDETLDKLKLDSELALRRAKRLVEFLDAVCQNERQILKPEVKAKVRRRTPAKAAADSGSE